ncbi:MAG: twin-arginine translocase TatA/TatE family subunit [Chloroflexota bacterium]|nr:twin-arginine translocase TatA/TatE family subunit [Chloroflexota bacterium]
MNLFGVGFLELAVIFLIAFLVMGPAKAIEMARTAGKLIGDMRRTVNEMTAATDLNEPRPTAPPPAPPQAPGPPVEPPPGAVPTSGPEEGNEQQPRTHTD